VRRLVKDILTASAAVLALIVVCLPLESGIRWAVERGHLLLAYALAAVTIALSLAAAGWVTYVMLIRWARDMRRL
jgi:hypothetical protein